MKSLFLGKIKDLKKEGDKQLVAVDLLKKGEYYHPKAPGQKLIVDDSLINDLVENFKKGIAGNTIPSNIDHQNKSCFPSPAWLVDMTPTKDGLVGIAEINDDKLAEDIRSKRIRFVSPEIRTNYKDTKSGGLYRVMRAFAWTNFPWIKGAEAAQIINLSEASHDYEEDTDLSEAVQSNLYRKLVDAIEDIYDSKKDFWEKTESFQSSSYYTDKIARIIFLSPYQQILALTKVMGEINKCIFEVFNTKNQLNNDPEIKEEIFEKTQKLQEIFSKILEDIEQKAEVNKEDSDDQEIQENDLSEQDNQNINDKDGDNVEDTQESENDEDQIPLQCNSCLKLASGTCPFIDIKSKQAAAGDGNCPQYIDVKSSTSFDTEPKNEESENEQDLSEATMTIEELKKMLEEQSATIAALSSQVGGLMTDKEALQNRLNLSEQTAEQVRIESARQNDRLFVDGLLKAGKINVPQGDILLSMLASERGDNDIELSEEFKSLSTRELMDRFINEFPKATPVEDKSTAEVQGNPGQVNLSEYEKREVEITTRAKEMAGNDPNYTKYYGAAAREVISKHSRGER
jgi:uncharacterized protein YoxC